MSRLEAAANEVLHLRSENESLRSDISFNHSELLFLKLQLKLLETQTTPYPEQVEQSLLDGLERWKLDWIDVEQRFRGRRDRYADEEANGTLDGDEDVQGGYATLHTHNAVNGYAEPSSVPTKLDIMQQGLDARAEAPSAPAVALATANDGFDAPNSDLTSLDNLHRLAEPTDVRHKRDISQSSCLDTDEDIPLDQQTPKGVEVRVKKIIIKDKREKTPWQELWEGLYALAGMDRD